MSEALRAYLWLIPALPLLAATVTAFLGPRLLRQRSHWPAILAGSLAYCAMFHLVGAYFRRPAVVAIVYTFFLETFLGSLPGHMKRVSISFYTRCLMYDVARDYGLTQRESDAVFIPVTGTTALWMLLGLTVLLLGVGAVVFARQEYHEI